MATHKRCPCRLRLVRSPCPYSFVQCRQKAAHKVERGKKKKSKAVSSPTCTSKKTNGFVQVRRKKKKTKQKHSRPQTPFFFYGLCLKGRFLRAHTLSLQTAYLNHLFLTPSYDKTQASRSNTLFQQGRRGKWASANLRQTTASPLGGKRRPLWWTVSRTGQTSPARFNNGLATRCSSWTWSRALGSWSPPSEWFSVRFRFGLVCFSRFVISVFY